MSKRGGGKKSGGKKDKHPIADGSPFTNNAFAGLATLGDALPAGLIAPALPKAAVLPEAAKAKAAKAKAPANVAKAPASVAKIPAKVPGPASKVVAKVPKSPSRFPTKLVVRMEKKGRRGKTVTRVSGVPQNDLAALCKEMKKALGCGATIEDADLILLGDLVSRAVAWFEKAGAAKIVRGT